MARLLLVDDEVGLRQGLARFLRLGGHEVREAGGMEEALALARQEPPQMVITDLRMPDGTGLDLAARLRQVAPQVRTILVTGYAERALLSGDPPPGLAAVLEKPVRPRDLRAAVARILTGARQPQKRPAPPGPAPSETAPARERRELRQELWGLEGA